MTRETRIGMLIGLLFIFAFGLVLSEFYGPTGPPSTASVQQAGPRPNRQGDRAMPQHVDRIHRQQPRQQVSRREESRDVRQRQPQSNFAVYAIRQGDTLTSIARKQMGDDSANAVSRLYNANVDRLQSPDRLVVGTKIRIPRN